MIPAEFIFVTHKPLNLQCISLIFKNEELNLLTVNLSFEGEKGKGDWQSQLVARRAASSVPSNLETLVSTFLQ